MGWSLSIHKVVPLYHDIYALLKLEMFLSSHENGNANQQGKMILLHTRLRSQQNQFNKYSEHIQQDLPLLYKNKMSSTRIHDLYICITLIQMKGFLSRKYIFLMA